MGLKDLARPPFANYDVVVYFGCGLFVIPFLNRYLLGPFELNWPTFQVALEPTIAAQIVSGLSLIFAIYIIGHIIAYVASQLIEKTIDRFLGKVSTAIILLSVDQPGLRNSRIRRHILRKVREIRSERAILASAFRAAFHIPAIPIYAFVGLFGVFGYYNTRITKHTLVALRSRVRQLGVPHLDIGPRMPWFKPVEYYVINRIPDAVPRMYNYLVIGGLFRSLSLIFLFSMWAVIGHYLVFRSSDSWAITPLGGKQTVVVFAVEYILLSLLYTFSLFSYVKFQRRYAEEAIFALIFSEPPPLGTGWGSEIAPRRRT